MTSKNLWGELPTGEESGRSPKAILEEQARFLSESSENDLRGKVITRRIESQPEHELIIVAPYLNNYEVAVVNAVHSAETYPVTVWNSVGEGTSNVTCKSVEEFEAELGKILTSRKVRSIIGSLLSQAPQRPPSYGGVRTF